MSRSSEDFIDAAFPEAPKPYKEKGFRYGAREAREFFSGEESGVKKIARSSLSSEKSSIYTYRSVGRGVQGESSN